MLSLTRRRLETGFWGTAPVLDPTLEGLEVKLPRSTQPYIPMNRGFMYPVAMDWHSRKILFWRVSNTLEADFCVPAVQEAISRYGSAEIFNTDQGGQFTDKSFTDLLKDHGIRISVDGRRRVQDNIFIEGLW